jgi:hypothetical protein
MYGPAVRCKWFRRAGCELLASMYPAFDWSFCSGPSWISARVRSRYRTGLDRAIWVTSVRMRVSSSRRPRLEAVDRVTSSVATHIVQFLCSSQGPFLRPGPQSVDRVARRGGQGRPSRWLAAGSGVARLRLDRAEHGARTQASRTPASSVLVSSKARPLASIAQAMRASLLASAIASTLWCNRLLAASIQDLSP